MAASLPAALPAVACSFHERPHTSSRTTFPSLSPCHSEAYELWRPFRDCDYRCCTMLRRRGRPPLAIHVPAAQTGIDQNEDNEPQFVRAVSVPVCAAATPGATCTPRPSPFSAPVAAAAPSAAALAAAKLASAAALAAPASAASLAPTTAAQQQLTGSGSRSRPLHRSWHALAAELQALASPAHSSRGSLALSGSGESSSGSLSQGSPSPASVLRLQGAALPPRPPLAAALARLDCASARWQQAKAHLLAARAPPPQQLPQPQQQLFSASPAAAALPSAGAPASCCQPPAAWAAARVPAVPMLPV